MKLVLDTSVLISRTLPALPDADAYVASLCFAELELGVATATDPTERATRQARIDRFRTVFGRGLPFSDEAAAAYGQFCNVVLAAGRSPRSRLMDLMIAATAYVNNAGVLTRNVADFADLRPLMPIIAA
jgi:predicted nucleic acid-binding protein